MATKKYPLPHHLNLQKFITKKIVNISNFKKLRYVEFLSNLLDENCYPTKYIFEKYIKEEKDYRNNIEIKINDEKISANYLVKRLPKAFTDIKKTKSNFIW